MNRKSMAAAAAMAVVYTGAPLRAQATDQCAAYTTTLASGSLANADSQARAYAGIQSCAASVRGPAMSRALERRKHLADIHGRDAGAFAFATRDLAVFNTVVSMAGDRTASPAARVASVLVLLTMVDSVHHGAQLDRFLTQREGDICIAGGSPLTGRLEGGPLPPDSARRVRAALVPLERSSSTNPVVRSAAHCALNVLRMRQQGQPTPLASFNERDVTVTYVCGRTFRVTNRSRSNYLGEVRIDGRRTGTLTLSGTHGRGAAADTYYEATSDGGFEIVIDDVARYSATNGRRRCVGNER